MCQAKEKVRDIKETSGRSAASQYHCGPARLVLINGSPCPELVSRTRSFKLELIHQPTPTLPLNQHCSKNVSVVQNMGFPPKSRQKASNMCKSHSVSAVERSKRPCMATPMWVTQNWHRPLCWWMMAWVDCRSRSPLMMWVTLQGANHYEQPLINSFDEQFVKTNQTNCSNN